MKILIADDHGLFREGLRLVLSHMFDDVEIQEANNVDALIKQITDDIKPDLIKPDLILMDLQMPGMDHNVDDGVKHERFAGIKRVVKLATDTPVVIVSGFSNPEFIARAIELGAQGYIVKSSNQEVLKHALALVLSGQIYIPPDILSAIGTTGEFGSKRSNATENPSNLLAQLTSRQKDTLDLMILGKSNKEIARELSILESTVKAHVRVILQKLNASNRTEAARIAADLGWKSSDGM